MKVANGFPELETLWDFNSPENSEQRLSALLAEVSAAPQPDGSYRIEVLTQIARAQSLQTGKLPLAKETLKHAEEYLEQAETTYRVAAKIRFLIESGRIHVQLKNPALARPLFLQAWTLASNAGEDGHSIDAAQMMAMIEAPKAQRDWINKGLALAESSPQASARQYLGSLYSTLGWMQFELRQYETALETFKKAVSCHIAVGIQKKIIVAKWAIGRALRALNRIEEALEIQKDLLAELNRVEKKDGYVYEELAECLQSLKKTAEAQTYFDLAYRELSKDEWIADNKADRLKRLKDLGKVKL